MAKSILCHKNFDKELITALKSRPHRHDFEARFDKSNVTYKTQAIFMDPKNL